MNKKFYKKYGIIRESIKKDILFFGIPFFSILILGLIICNLEGYSLFSFLIVIINKPQNILLLSFQNIFGLSLIIFGYIIMFISAFTLRRNYSSTLIIRKNHKLITHGIYLYIRHPIYFGLIMVIFGFPMFSSNVIGFVVMLFSIPFILIRIYFEEKLLIAEFGIEYNKYKENTKKIIPYIY